jgi:hypothetical protein
MYLNVGTSFSGGNNSYIQYLLNIADISVLTTYINSLYYNNQFLSVMAYIDDGADIYKKLFSINSIVKHLYETTSV